MDISLFILEKLILELKTSPIKLDILVCWFPKSKCLYDK